MFASTEKIHCQLIEIYFSHRLNNFQNWNCQRFAPALHPGRGMKHFTQSSPSSKSTDFDTNLTPIQSAAAIALGFGLQIPAVAAELKIHRSTLYNWAKNPLFFRAVETANAEFQKQFRTQIAMLTRLALTNIQQILADTEASPSVRLKAALAVLKQDWKLPNSTDFDSIPEESDPLRNESALSSRSDPAGASPAPGVFGMPG